MMDQLSPSDRGVNFQLRYIGSMAINASMKSLEFSVRSALTKECITRTCEATHMISEKKRKIDKQILKFLPGQPNLENSGENVYLTVSTRHIVVTLMAQPQILFDHQLPEISFAAAGDQETADFIAYVAKDERHGRRCYVFECGVGHATEVISAVASAFNTRFDQVTSTPVTTISVRGIQQHPYPNSPGAPLMAAAGTSGHNQHNHMSPPEPPPRVTLASSSPRSPVLIDLNCSPTIPAAHAYVNTSDKFFAGSSASSLPYMKNLPEQPWFHQCMSREESESLLRQDGEFLVRARPQDPNQIVLSGLQNGVHKHLMLIDEEGKVRTKDREFESVVHLIEHHRNSLMPITSAESAILLRFPVHRKS